MAPQVNGNCSLAYQLPQTQIKAYGAPTLEKYRDHPRFRYVQVRAKLHCVIRL